MVEFFERYPIVASLITTFVTASLGYYFHQQNKKNDQFQTQVSENLKEVCSPIFFALRAIMKAKDSEMRSNLIIDFFSKI